MARRREQDHRHDDADEEGVFEIAMVGDLTDCESDLTDRLLSIPPGGECTIYFDSPGGSPYCAMSLMTLIRLRRLRATGIVTGECSSATLWPFAACQRRFVTPFSVLLFHPMRWQSEENVGLAEAAEWARHFGELEREMDRLLADLFGVDVEVMNDWINPGRYVTGRELAAIGLAELIELAPSTALSVVRPATKTLTSSPGSLGSNTKSRRQADAPAAKRVASEKRGRK
jgi:ATP-dependent protease ClpP protease subunit